MGMALDNWKDSDLREDIEDLYNELNPTKIELGQIYQYEDSTEYLVSVALMDSPCGNREGYYCLTNLDTGNSFHTLTKNIKNIFGSCFKRFKLLNYTVN